MIRLVQTNNVKQGYNRRRTNKQTDADQALKGQQVMLTGGESSDTAIQEE